MADEQLVQAATRAFVYGYPLVYNLAEIAKLPGGEAAISGGAPVPWNTFGCARELLDPSVDFVSPNNDTLYLLAPLDLSGGPVRLEVPDTADRYYVLQCVDAWTNNFAYIGRRATGTAAGSFTFVPPGFDGEVTDGSTVVHAPTDVMVIVGRLQVDGEADLPAVHALQDAFVLAEVDPDAPRAGLPEPDPAVPEALRWWEQFRVLLAAFPPPEGDAPFVAMLGRLGLTDATSPFVDASPELTEALVAGSTEGMAMIEKIIADAGQAGGWTKGQHYFDYNLDHYEVGTIDAPEWRCADRSTAAITRALAARVGLWGNHGYEAVYSVIYTDADGELLDAEHAYELTFSPAPPVDAFWSLTMYDNDKYYLVENPIDRYSIGDRTPGLQVADDGSVTIYLQRTSPGPDKESNWLPTPASGGFRPMLRAYQPGDSVKDGTYPMPDITRTDG
jgi:hypothetical protein